MRDSKEQDISDPAQQLFSAELQFRLAAAVELATNQKNQPLDLPEVWVRGDSKVTYNEIAIRQDQAEYASWHLLNSATFLMATEIKNAIRFKFSDPINHKDELISSSFQIARFIRNAFTHHPFKPIWSIEKEYQNKVYKVKDFIKLDTQRLNGKVFEWRQYGGPLAILRLCQFVRFEILGDSAKKPNERLVPGPKNKYIRMGNLILKKVDRIPPNAKRK
jgi:hypothetical protein